MAFHRAVGFADRSKAEVVGPTDHYPVEFAYNGLVFQQGLMPPSLCMDCFTNTGNPFLRRLLLQAGHYVLGPFGPDCDLRRWGMRLAAGGRGAKKRAAIAVARKLAVLMLVLWRDQRTYQPLRAA